MTDDDIQAYDAAAATLQEQLKTMFPDYTWWVPDTHAGLFSQAINAAIHEGWLYAYVKHGGYGARVPVSIGIERDTAAVRVIGQLAIRTMEKARQDIT